MYIIKILFQIKGVVDNQIIKDTVHNRIRVMKLDDGQLNESALSIQVTSSHTSHITKGLVEIPYNNLEKAAFISATIESIGGVAGHKAEFSFLEIEDVVSTRNKIQPRIDEILDSYKLTHTRIQSIPSYKRISIESIHVKVKSLLPKVQLILRSGTSASSYPLILALILFVASATFLIQGNSMDARISIEYTFLLAAIGTVWKFINHLRDRKHEPEGNEKILTSS